MIWFIILNVVMNDGTLYTEVQFPNKPEYNNEQDCNNAGRAIVDQKQIEVGTANGKAYFLCRAITPEDIRNATGKSGSNT